MSTTPATRRRVADPRRDTTLAWLSLLLYPVTLVAAFLVGEGLLETAADARSPSWGALGGGLLALVVFALPAPLAWYFGMRAHRKGSRTGRVAAWVGVLVAAVFATQNLLAFLVGLLA